MGVEQAATNLALKLLEDCQAEELAHLKLRLIRDRQAVRFAALKKLHEAIHEDFVLARSEHIRDDRMGILRANIEGEME